MSDQQFDLVILGSGSTAFAASLKAAELGKTAAMTESRTLGGTCVNRGCLPSKNLIEAARIYWEAAHPRFPGLGGKKLDLDFRELIRGKDEVIRSYRDRKYGSILDDRDRIKVFRGHAALVDPHAVQVNGTRLVGDQILVATGSRPTVPKIAGLESVPYLTSDLLTSDEPMEMWEQPRSLVIVGGGYIGLELAQAFQRLGTQVTVLQRSDRILSEYEPEVSSAVEQALREEGMDIRTGFGIVGVRTDGDGVCVVVEGTTVRRGEVHAERLLVATGRTPNTDDIGLDTAGVDVDERGFVKVDEHLRTSVPHIWAAGDVIGTNTGAQMATPVGAHDGVIAAANSLGDEGRTVDHSVLPRTIFTDPQVGVVGLTDAQANAKGFVCSCNTVPIHLVPRAGAVRDERGIIKMVLERDTGKVLGVSMVGRDAGEVIHEAAMGMRFGATVYDFIDMVHVYPTMAEALKIVGLSFFKDVSKMSCCAE
ncbi:MAG: mercury(II) reductase [Chloroflexi bacterium]|nr:mercury(II) reductase [Chloroflexota bacterium]